MRQPGDVADRNDPRVVCAALAGAASLARSQGATGGQLASLLADGLLTIHRLIDELADLRDVCDVAKDRAVGLEQLLERQTEINTELAVRLSKLDTQKRQAAARKGRKKAAKPVKRG